MWRGLLWFAFLAAAGLCYPRRPGTAGMLWSTLGVLPVVLKFLSGSVGWMGAASGMFTGALGLRYLIKYSSPEVRAKHVGYWTAKA